MAITPNSAKVMGVSSLKKKYRRRPLKQAHRRPPAAAPSAAAAHRATLVLRTGRSDHARWC